MDPNPSSFPILSYIMNRVPTLTSTPRASTANLNISDLHSIQIDDSLPPTLHHMPHLSDPKLIAAMSRAVSDVSQTRSVLAALGPRPDHESVDAARSNLSLIDSSLSKKLESVVLSPRPSDVDRFQWRAHLSEREQECRDAAEKERREYKAVLQLDELHASYEKLLKDAEVRLEKIYRSAAEDGVVEEEEANAVVSDDLNEEVVGILHQANGGAAAALDRVNLSGRRLKFLPEAFGRIAGLLQLNLSTNELKFIPDTICELEKLQELNVSSNLLETLPDAIGLLQNLKVLSVSSNKLTALPDSIAHCKSLVELDVSFNNLSYLPTNIGFELVNLQKLSIQLNKIRSLPSSLCELRSLRSLDAHFNELRGLPLSFSRLTSLETLNLASNFTDLTELPDTFGDLTNLKELDLSNNQLHDLPVTFGRLDNLAKLNLDGNPLVFPPADIIQQGVEAVKICAAKRWLEILIEEERKSMLQVEEEAETGWLTRSASWLTRSLSGVSGYLTSPRSLRSPRDPALDQQF